jgi:hypothetical protein
VLVYIKKTLKPREQGKRRKGEKGKTKGKGLPREKGKGKRKVIPEEKGKEETISKIPPRFLLGNIYMFFKLTLFFRFEPQLNRILLKVMM